MRIISILESNLNSNFHNFHKSLEGINIKNQKLKNLSFTMFCEKHVKCLKWSFNFAILDQNFFNKLCDFKNCQSFYTLMNCFSIKIWIFKNVKIEQWGIIEDNSRTFKKMFMIISQIQKKQTKPNKRLFFFNFNVKIYTFEP